MTLPPAGRKSQLRAIARGAGVLAAIVLAGPPDARADLEITGLDDALETNVRILSPLSTTSCDTADWRIERLFRNADDNIRQSLRALGYYDPVIRKSLSRDDECWQVTFDIDAGKPVRLSTVAVAIDGPAADDPEFRKRIAADEPRRGAILHHGRFEDFKVSLVRAATYTGYFDADFERSQITVDPAMLAADLDLAFASGPKYRFGEVSFTDGILRDTLLQRYSDIRPGDPYSGKLIVDLQQALSGSAYFRSVQISTEPLDEEAKTIPVRVNLTPSKRHVFSAGGGFTTDMGPHLRLGYSNRRINDRGHQFESRLYASPVDSELNLGYRWPVRDPRSDWLSVVAGGQHQETDTSELDKATLGILHTSKNRWAWLETRYVNVEWENFIVADQDTSSQLVIVGTNWEKAVGRALGRATQGYWLNFDVRGASDYLGSDTSFLQLRTRSRWIHSFGERTRVLARANLGATVKDALVELPASVRFFSGGDRSVRGYEYQSLGPTNADGDVIGGAHKIDLSVEFDFLFRDQWTVAAFVDSGTAFDTTDVNFSTGVGLGLRWYSPIGPIRVDFAHPLDDPTNNLRIHISLGPDL